ncbi:MAG: hypothetical protein JXR88_18485 [Clostridia bacterium]|nr:hypothetical protein [Clostridia bacterium]
MEKKEIIKAKDTNSKLMQYCQELVMLQFAYDNKFLTKDEMLIVKSDIEKSYGMQRASLL